MADNRMFLVHVPTGLAMAVAKRYSPPWMSADMGKLQAFFDHVATDHGGYDEFALACESPSPFGHALEIECYLSEEKGFLRLKLKGIEQEDIICP